MFEYSLNCEDDIEAGKTIWTGECVGQSVAAN